MSRIADNLRKLEKYDEVLKIEKTILNLRIKILGNSHPDTIKSMKEMAYTLHIIGRHYEAFQIEQQLI